MAEENNFVYGVAYGKLYLAGEYAILENYSKALLTGVPKKITAIIEPDKKTTIFDTLHNKTIGLYDVNPDFKLIQDFILFIKEYTKSEKTFALTVYNELHGEEKKYGLGSSGAVLVAITKAIFTFEQIDFNNEIIFKLVALFNIKYNLSGSMGDVAASLNEGLTYYQKFNKDKLNELINTKSIEEIIETPWDGLVIKNITPKAKVTIFARWTGEAIDTKEHVKLWKENKKNLETQFNKFVSNSNLLVDELVKNIEDGFTLQTLETFKLLRENLHYLESFSNIPMETSAMKRYIEQFPAGKQSGSGSGDIVLGLDKNDEKFTLDLNLEKL